MPPAVTYSVKKEEKKMSEAQTPDYKPSYRGVFPVMKTEGIKTTTSATYTKIAEWTVASEYGELNEIIIELKTTIKSDFNIYVGNRKVVSAYRPTTTLLKIPFNNIRLENATTVMVEGNSNDGSTSVNISAIIVGSEHYEYQYFNQ